ncbi:MAG: glycosyltransferase family 2 protein [Bacteroidales bacterium]|nr:glycosyltransferase family 2 protein [Bacteroidales bacterium]
MKKVAVIILNWNGMSHGLIRRYLPSVVENTNPNLADVIVADNGSTDNSLEVIAQEFPSVRTIALSQNFGFAEGYNQAIAQVEHPYVVLLNDDVACAPHWLDPLVEYMEQHSEVLAAQPKLKSDRDRTLFEYAGAAGGFLDRMGYPYCRGRLFQDVEKDLGQYDSPCAIDWATGACLMVRRQAYLDAGGLDGEFFAHMEEIDLCWRLRRMGGKVMCLPFSEVYHLGGASLSADNPRKTLLNFRNSLLMLYKNLPEDQRDGILFRRKLLDGLAALNFILHGQFVHAKAIWRAHRQASQMIRDIYSKAPASSTLFGLAPLGQVNILYRYYIKRQKTFSSLTI